MMTFIKFSTLRVKLLSSKPEAGADLWGGIRVTDAAIALAPVLTALVCIGIGRYGVSVPETVRALLSPLSGEELDPLTMSVIWGIRLPRIILALLVGGGLSVAGASFQALFSNPLATPDTLGVATGASFGAAVALLFHADMLAVQVSAMVCGFSALLITTSISRQGGNNSIVMVVLAGIVVSAIFQAFLSLVQYLANPEDTLPTITYWLLGSMAKANFKSLLRGAPFILSGVALLFSLRWRLNVLSLQEDEAKSLGINVKNTRLAVMAASTMVTAAGISLCGQVGWIGLLVPHMSRMIYGGDNRRVIPASICLGGALLVLIDTLARGATAAEIPVSVLTAIIGAPFFILLLRKTGGARL
jgi:iron complex transport system permease protein